MSWLSLPLLLACSGQSPVLDLPLPPRPSSFADPRLKESGAGPATRLWLTPGRYQLPASTLPPGFEPEARFPVVLEPTILKERKNTKVFRAPSPFPIEMKDEARVSAPPGMLLFVGEETLPYHQSLHGKSWRITGERLLVAWPDDAPPPVTVQYQPARELLLRLDFATADLPAETFVKHSVTLSDRTRHGLLLPAPGTAEWDVKVPAMGAVFEGWLALPRLPLRALASDGATASLVVVVDGVEKVVDEKFIDPEAEDFAVWRVSLQEWAGQDVTLRLSSGPHRTTDFDHVFIGSPTVWGDATGEPRRIVVIGLDTTRPDHFGFYGYGRDTTPELDEVARTSVVFDHAWTPAPRTRPSFRSAFTGRRPLDAVGAPNLSEVFHREGFATAGLVANIHLQPRFDFDVGFDDWWYDSHSKADDQVDRAIAWLDGNAQRDTFLFLHIMDPHLFYNAPSAFRNQWVDDPDPTLPEVFTRWDVLGWIRAGRMDDRRRKHIAALYDAEVRFMSQELGRFYAYLDRLGGRTLVVTHSDHGEELFEHGLFEHNHNVYDVTTRAVLWFRTPPGQTEGRRIHSPATLADIGPTLFDFAGITGPPTDGRSLAPLLLGAEPDASFHERAIGIAHLRYGLEVWAVVWRGHKYILHTASGLEELFDLTADPGETVNLAMKTPLTEYRTQLAQAHDMTVGRGWRVSVQLMPNSGPVRLKLPQAATHAVIVDPEATIENPANEEWGEIPRKVEADVGSLSLSEDGLEVVFTPGRLPAGSFVIVFGADVDPGTVVAARSDVALVTMQTRGTLSWKAGNESIEITAGTVLVPPIDEATRIRALRGEGADDAGDERAELCLLGYVECEKPSGDH